MHIHYQSKLRYVRKLMLRLPMCTAVMINAGAFAGDQTTDESVDNRKAKAEHNEKDEQHPAVDLGPGPGGVIKQEKMRRTEAESKYKWHMYMIWDSRYVSEGRDNLHSNDMFSLSSEFNLDDITFIPWFARSPGVDFTELDLNFVYSVSVSRKIKVFLGYTHIRYHYQEEHLNDNEISLALGYQPLQSLTLSSVIYHSFYADGSFVELSSSYFGEISKRTSYNIAVSLGANEGYIYDGHTGLNHFQLQATTSYLPSIQVELYAMAGYNQAINRDAGQYPGDETLKDFFWGSLGMVYLF
jgi:hypothetical protein